MTVRRHLHQSAPRVAAGRSTRTRATGGLLVSVAVLLSGCSWVEAVDRDLRSDPVLVTLAPQARDALLEEVTGADLSRQSQLRAVLDPLGPGCVFTPTEVLPCLVRTASLPDVPTEQEGLAADGFVAPPADLSPEELADAATQVVEGARAAGWEVVSEDAGRTLLLAPGSPGPQEPPSSRAELVVFAPDAAQGRPARITGSWDTGCRLAD